jgi:prophage regulatory protein
MGSKIRLGWDRFHANMVGGVTGWITEPEVLRSLKSTGEVIRRKELCKITGLSMATLWRWEREGNFPARIRLSPHSVGWRRSDIETWLATRPTSIGPLTKYGGNASLLTSLHPVSSSPPLTGDTVTGQRIGV